LDADGTDRHGRAETLIEYMKRKLPKGVEVTKLERYLEKMPIENGRYLMRQADDSDSLYFVESGKLAVMIEGEGGAQMRIRSVNHGTIGEVGMYIGLPRTASVWAEEDSTVYRLAREDLARMEKEHPELASAFHKFIARRLAQRLANTTEVLREVLD
jgi:SulP family sulfate permease